MDQLTIRNSQINICRRFRPWTLPNLGPMKRLISSLRENGCTCESVSCESTLSCTQDRTHVTIFRKLPRKGANRSRLNRIVLTNAIDSLMSFEDWRLRCHLKSLHDSRADSTLRTQSKRFLVVRYTLSRVCVNVLTCWIPWFHAICAIECTRKLDGFSYFSIYTYARVTETANIKSYICS